MRGLGPGAPWIRPFWLVRHVSLHHTGTGSHQATPHHSQVRNVRVYCTPRTIGHRPISGPLSPQCDGTGPASSRVAEEASGRVCLCRPPHRVSLLPTTLGVSAAHHTRCLYCPPHQVSLPPTTPGVSAAHHTGCLCCPPHRGSLLPTTPGVSAAHHTRCLCCPPHRGSLLLTTPGVSTAHHTRCLYHPPHRVSLQPTTPGVSAAHHTGCLCSPPHRGSLPPTTPGVSAARHTGWQLYLCQGPLSPQFDSRLPEIRNHAKSREVFLPISIAHCAGNTVPPHRLKQFEQANPHIHTERKR